mmetsp:Transcript_97566/g.209330  ORF Transcript_97566/g.209330 Transcript_97566/m.209330 type:complete len:200 (+) Transcript_97566:635-1234(+)
MHAEFAVVQVDALRCLWVDRQHAAQSRRKEDSIGVDLHGPIVVPIQASGDDLLPDLDKDVEVQCSPELPALAALEVAIDNSGVEAGPHLDDPAAVDCVLIATEQAHTGLVLHGQQLLLVGIRQHECEAKEGSGLNVLLRSKEVADVAGSPLLVRTVRVARSHVDRAPISVPLPCVQADASPVLDEASGFIIGPLLAEVV